VIEQMNIDGGHSQMGFFLSASCTLLTAAGAVAHSVNGSALSLTVTLLSFGITLIVGGLTIYEKLLSIKKLKRENVKDRT